ncbi:hypothetical protein E6O51_14145 [Pseudothauera rhizosphaerae]|uniref:Uncharacterized protein n=1 Tax=Pseudothauera rhizosphaerae TaxID=2565932 RepID=A0A4S4ALG0_9RHOO|nr:hypothetical protein E6O51_14145 [Pseudothauera rhizosphaerae]
MSHYYINKNQQANGDHEVHIDTCSYLPSEPNRIYLGNYYSCAPAVAEAKRRWPTNRINGCFYCCRPCHTS